MKRGCISIVFEKKEPGHVCVAVEGPDGKIPKDVQKAVVDKLTMFFCAPYCSNVNTKRGDRP